MRIDRLTILLLLVGCKAATPPSASNGAYSEDLSIHRPVIVIEEAQPAGATPALTIEQYVPMEDHIAVELDSISKIALAENKAGKYVDGFVIQIYSGNDRSKANSALAEIADDYPDLNPKMSYRQPNFRVKAGRFTNRLQANRIYEQVKGAFPKALLIPERFLLKYD